MFVYKILLPVLASTTSAENKEKKKKKKKGKVKFTIEQAMKAQRGSRGIALLFI
jgi:hypothetical protein